VIYNANNQLGRTVQEGGTGAACTVPTGGAVDPCIADSPEGLCGGPQRCIPDLDEMGRPLPTGVCGIPCGARPCMTSAQGALFDCDKLLDTPQNGLSGGALAVSFPSIDANLILDNVTSTLFVFQ